MQFFNIITVTIFEEDLNALEAYLNIDVMNNLTSGTEREINQPDNILEDTPLTFAIMKLASGHFKNEKTIVDIIKKLLEFGADPHFESDSGSAMSLAINHGLTEIVKILQEPVKPIFDDNLSREEKIMAFIDDFSLLFESTNDYMTLKIALNLDEVEVLMGKKSKSEINDLNKFSQTLIQHAISKHRSSPETLKKVIKLLLDHGADPLQEDAFGMSALNVAETLEIEQEIIDLIKNHIKTEQNEEIHENSANNENSGDSSEFKTSEELLIKAINGIAKVRLIPKNASSSPIEFLYSKEEAINLTIIAMKEHMELFRNNDMNMLNAIFLNIILEKNELNIIEIIKENMDLINEGLEQTDDSKFIGKKITLLHAAIIADKIDVAKFLIENGTNVNIIDLDNDTPITLSAMLGYADLIEQLHSKGANLEHQNVEHTSALCTAILHERNEAIEKLVELGASLTNKCMLEHRPIDIAKRRKLSDYYEVLQPKENDSEENMLIISAEEFIELIGEEDSYYEEVI